MNKILLSIFLAGVCAYVQSSTLPVHHEKWISIHDAFEEHADSQQAMCAFHDQTSESVDDDENDLSSSTWEDENVFDESQEDEFSSEDDENVLSLSEEDSESGEFDESSDVSRHHGGGGHHHKKHHKKKCARCNKRRFARCGMRYARHFGITRRHHSLKDFLIAFTRVLKTQGGKRGWTNICRWNKEFFECGGKQVFPGCYKVKSLMRMGLPFKEALMVSELRAELVYECTEGFDVIANDRNWNCYNRTMHANTRKIRSCFETFKKTIRTQKCKAVQKVNDCFSSIYRRPCGAAVAANSCNSMKAALQIPFRKCKIQCKKSSRTLLEELNSGVLTDLSSEDSALQEALDEMVASESSESLE